MNEEKEDEIKKIKMVEALADSHRRECFAKRVKDNADYFWKCPDCGYVITKHSIGI